MKWVDDGAMKKGVGNESSANRQDLVPPKIPAKNISKPVENHSLKIRFHHKGYFTSDPVIAYKKGEVYEFGGAWDIDEINLIDLEKLVREIGVKGDFKLWYVSPGTQLSEGLKLLKTDRDIIRFINEHKGENVADFYVGEEVAEDETNSEYLPNEDEDLAEAGSVDDVSLYDNDYDEGWEWKSVVPKKTLNPIPVIPFALHDQSLVRAESSRNVVATTELDFADDNGDFEDLESPYSSDDDTVKKTLSKFKLTDDGVKYEEGQIFANAELVKASIKEYTLQSRKNVYLKKNEKKRIVAGHNCYHTGKVRLITTTILAKKLVPTLKHTPGMTIKALEQECTNRWGLMVSKFQMYRAKMKALEMIHGAVDEQYAHLRNYTEELLRSNPDSTVKIKCKLGVGGPVFERMYVCFYACKKAFVGNCRPLIGLYGCFLKGRYAGHLLSAIGKNGNNQMMPIAFAIVEAETKESWDWFIELLLSDLNEIQYKKWSFISDQQKGLVNTIAGVSTNVEHRLCVRHLYGNWRKINSGEILKEAMWAATRCNTMLEFKKAMEKLKAISEPAWKEMNDLVPGMWSREGYSTHTCCDLQVNNMCEAFNIAILEYRELPIISLVKGLMFYIINRIVRLRDYMLRYEGDICPMIKKILDKAKRDVDGWSPNWSGDKDYSSFSDGTDTYVVNLQDKTCACRKWNLTGIPCPHSISAMRFNNQNPDEFVAHWYRRAPGRPKKLRKKTNDEPKTTTGKRKRNQETVRCKRCGELGHNLRTCKGKTAGDRIIPVGGNKTNTNVKQPGTSNNNGATTSKNGPKTGATVKKNGLKTTKKNGPASATNNNAPAISATATSTIPPTTAQPVTTISVSNKSNAPPATVISATTRKYVHSASNPMHSPRGAKHNVGGEALFVPKKTRTTDQKRKSVEMDAVGTQQSVNKP